MTTKKRGRGHRWTYVRGDSMTTEGSLEYCAQCGTYLRCKQVETSSVGVRTATFKLVMSRQYSIDFGVKWSYANPGCDPARRPIPAKGPIPPLVEPNDTRGEREKAFAKHMKHLVDRLAEAAEEHGIPLLVAAELDHGVCKATTQHADRFTHADLKSAVTLVEKD